MSENNQMMSVEGQLVGMPLAGPESFSQQQLDYLKRALGVDETVLWEGTITKTDTTNVNVVITLSESVLNFDRIRVYCNGRINLMEWHPNDVNGIVAYQANPESTSIVIAAAINQESNRTQIRYRCGFSNNYPGAFAGDYWYYGLPYKVVGIHRIAGGNT